MQERKYNNMENKLYVGFDRQQITPEEPIPLAGYSNELARFHTRVTEPICVTCVAVSDAADTTILMMTVDFCTIAGDLAVELRETVCEATGMPEDRVFIAATHTHSAPAMAQTQLPCMQKYRQQANEKFALASKNALADRKPASMFTGSIEVERMNFVKHYKAYDPKTKEVSYLGDLFGNPKGKVLLDHATQVDKTMHLVKFAREGGKDVVVANWRAHPHFSGGTKRYDLSADYIGCFRDSLELAEDCHVAYFQGACGNINSFSRFPGECPYTNQRSFGAALAGRASEALTKYMSAVEVGPIRTKQVIHYGEPNHKFNHVLEKAQQIWKTWKETYDVPLCTEMGLPYGIRSPYHASAVIGNAARTKEKDGQIILNAVAIGNAFGFVTMPFEVFDSLSVRIEDNSPFFTTMMLGYCYHHRGYLPSRAGFKYTSYETDVTRFEEGTGEQLADICVEMLEELKKQ